MISVILGLALIGGAAQEQFINGKLNDGTGSYRVYLSALNEPQKSPQKFGTPPEQWSFFYHTDGYAFGDGDNGQDSLRFRVFSQSADRNVSMGRAVALELLVLWRMDHDRLGIDHKADVNRRVVDVYLCEEGTPGGEQLFETVPGDTGPQQVNSIYIYDVAHFSDHMEQAREVAHEYGHAELTPIGGFDDANGAEYWINGNLGEKLFLRWGRDAMVTRALQEMDFMSTSVAQIDLWIKNHVNPLVKAAAVRRPDSPLYSGKARKSFDAFQGLVLWCDSIMPPKMFARTLRLISSYNVATCNYAGSAAMAAGEATYSPNIPAYLAHTAVWIPVGDGTVTGGMVLASRGGWRLVRPSTGPILVKAKAEAG